MAPSNQANFLAQSVAWIWIVSAVLVIPISIYALARIRFKIGRVGLFVISFYNVLFVLELYASIATLIALAEDSTTGAPKVAIVITQVLKNLDIVFKAYFTFEMLRVRIWIESTTPTELNAKMKKMRFLAIILVPVIVVNQAMGIVLGLFADNITLKAVCTSVLLIALCPMLLIFCSQIKFFVHKKLS